MFAKCVDCKRTWNISIYRIIYSYGYICPHCAGKRKRKKPPIKAAK